MSKALNRAFTVRIHLDETFSRRTTSSKKHWVGSTFTAFAVVRSSSKKFVLNLVADPKNSKINSFPLRRGFFQNFNTTVGDACFENPAEQPDQWVDVMFLVEDRFDSNPSEDFVESSVVTLGHVSAPLDGLTRQIEWRWSFDKGMYWCQDIEDATGLGNGEISNDTDPDNIATYSCFKVPRGFIAEIIACELRVRSVVSVASTVARVCALDDGTTYAEDDISTKAVAIIHDNDNAPTATGDYNVRLSKVVTGKRGIILEENQIPVVAIRNAFTGGATSGSYHGMFLIRLKPVEEA